MELNATKAGVKRYWDYGSKFYDTAPGTGSGEEHAIWKRLLSKSIGSGNYTILDVGTGTGFIALHLAELGHHVTAVDFSKDMMEIAEKNALERGFDIKFKEGDVESLPFENNSFDIITGRYVLWTMTDPDKAVKEWVRIVKPGGKIILIDGEWTTKGFLPLLCTLNYHVYRFFKYGKNPFTYDYKKEISTSLPNPHGVKKEQVGEYLRKAGVTDIEFTDLKQIREVQRKQLPWYLKYSNEHPTYLVSGVAQK